MTHDRGPWNAIKQEGAKYQNKDKRAAYMSAEDRGPAPSTNTINKEVDYKKYEHGKNKFMYMYTLNTRRLHYIITKKKYNVNDPIDEGEKILLRDEAFILWDAQFDHTNTHHKKV